MATIEFRNVSHIYARKTNMATEALKNVSVTIPGDRITGVIGHTGSGKSTLVSMMNGLIRPTDGQVLLDGKDVWEKPKKIAAVRFRVGLVMQYPEYQLFEETVGKDIAYGPKNKKLSDEEIAERVREAAGFTGITGEMLGRSPFDLSGGQKRRVALAGVIAMRPEILVLDEPAAGLDPRGRKEILGGIREYQRKTGTGVVIVSHSMEDMAEYCDDLIVMDHGEVVMHAPCGEVFSRAEELSAIGLDVPQITKISVEMSRMGMDFGSFYTVDGALKAIAGRLGGEPRE